MNAYDMVYAPVSIPVDFVYQWYFAPPGRLITLFHLYVSSNHILDMVVNQGVSRIGAAMSVSSPDVVNTMPIRIDAEEYERQHGRSMTDEEFTALVMTYSSTNLKGWLRPVSAGDLRGLKYAEAYPYPASSNYGEYQRGGFPIHPADASVVLPKWWPRTP